MNKLAAWSLTAVLIAVPVIALGTWNARYNARLTLQEMFDKDATAKVFTVESVFQPFTAGLPMYAGLVELGLVSPRIAGTFMVHRKDGAKLSQGCTFGEFEFTQSVSSARSFLSVTGIEMMKLRMCAASSADD
jgi:hypothetical protein